MTGLILVTSAGALLTYKGVLNESTNKSLSVAFSHVFWPLFMFWNIADILTKISQTDNIWPLIANPIFAAFAGIPFILAYAYLARPPSSLRATMLTCVMFTTGGIFTVIVGKDACEEGGALNGAEQCKWLDGYNMIQTAVYGVIFWTAAPMLIKQEAEEVKVFNATGSLAESRASRKNHKFTYYLMNALKGPVPKFSVLAIIFSFIPGVKYLFFEPDSPLAAVTDVCKEMGYYGLLASQLGFGSSIFLISKHTRIAQANYIYTAAIVRNVVMSFAGLALVLLAMNMGIMANDKVMAFVVLMNWITPPPIGCLFIATECDHAVDELALLLAVSFPLSIFTMASCLYLFFTFA
eukprot:CAMPEP_0204896582 /NCGR_PEP_ID=MMETSP1397-20131031/246_1 /ASSEMBLY_ACC=CAM_ASM_000891 /TAXON_ID=49980 /ORGANISM="Climacostomum Climacostomum virens, Strain Stock W-24" /LENGTH=350 /DNA_ID=CAMNT_0052064213 /DNA_START=2710 /DNA_END=3762 /DNA_ORIENTATION=-